MGGWRERSSVFDWLFPNWSTPALVAGVVALRFLLNAGLTSLVAGATGRSSRATVAAGAITVGGAVVAVLVLRGGTLGRSASLVDLLAQLALIGLGGYATYGHRSRGRVLAYAVLGLATLAVGLYTIPLYGESTVAP